MNKDSNINLFKSKFVFVTFSIKASHYLFNKNNILQMIYTALQNVTCKQYRKKKIRNNTVNEKR